MTSRNKYQPQPSEAYERQADLHKLAKLIESGQYDQLAKLLSQSQITNEQVGESFQAEMLSAARHICLACSRSRSEMDWHRHAEQEAGDRERELKRQLYALLEIINVEVEGAAQAGTKQNASDDPLPVKVEKKDSLTVLCLGPFRIYRNDQMIGNWHSQKGLTILKYLVKHHKAPIAKDVLMEAFWPEAEPECARRNLHQAIYNLRQMLKRGQANFQPILFENDCYLFNPEIALSLDFEMFEQHVQAGRRSEAAGRLDEAFAEYRLAEELYRGDFMEEDPYEDWAALQREQIRNIYFDVADRLSERYYQQKEYAAAIDLCQKILAKDNCHEQAYRRLMRCYQNMGQQGMAIRLYRLCEETLKKELGAPPDEETRGLFDKIVGNSRKLGWLARLTT